MNTEKISSMCDWERKKAVFLMGIAENDLNMNLSDYGEIAVNENSGYTYLWLENCNFSLYMPISCELKKTDICALWSCSNCGEELDYSLKVCDTLKDIEEAISELEKEHLKNKEECN